MTRQPSLPIFIGIAIFMTVVAVLVAGNIPLGESFQSRLLAYLSVFAAAQTTVTYVMTQRWLEYAENNSTESRQGGPTDAPPGN